MNALEIDRTCKAILKGELPITDELRQYLRRADSYAVTYCPGMFHTLDRVAAFIAAHAAAHAQEAK